jgi:hypothetical protein
LRQAAPAAANKPWRDLEVVNASEWMRGFMPSIAVVTEIDRFVSQCRRTANDVLTSASLVTPRHQHVGKARKIARFRKGDSVRVRHCVAARTGAPQARTSCRWNAT